MIESGDWVTPRLNYVKYFEKPPLFYWLVAIALRLGGENEASARLVPAVIATLGVISTATLAGAVWGGSAGLWSGCILATNLLYFALAREVVIDMLFSVLFALSVLAWGWAYSSRGKHEGAWHLASGALLGLAVLAKGPVACLLALGIALVVVTIDRDRQYLFQRHTLTGLAAMLAMSAPWFILVSLQNPEFPRYFVVVQHIERFLGSGIPEHVKPWHFFLPIAIAGFLPWSALLPAVVSSLCRGRKEDSLSQRRMTTVLASGTVVVLVFFSASKCKLIPYILPLWPFMAALLGVYCSRWFSEAKSCDGSARLGLAILGALVLLAPVAIWRFANNQHDVPPERILPHLRILSVGLVVWGVAQVFLAGARARQGSAWALVAGMLMVCLCLLTTIPVVAPCKAVRGILPDSLCPAPKEAVFAHWVGYEQSLGFYTHHRVTLLRNDPGELRFGAAQEPSDQWFLPGLRELSALMESSRPVFCVVKIEMASRFPTEVSSHATEIRRNADMVLFANEPALQLVGRPAAKGAPL